MDLYNVNAIHVYFCRGLSGERLVAYRPETAGHVVILETDVAWNVHHMEKLIVPIPSTVIEDQQPKSLLNQAKEKKTRGINKQPPASSSLLRSC